MAASLNLAGSDIGRYRLVSLIGAGGMGEVYDAIDSSLGRHVALKILKADAGSDPKRLARFVQEARSASALNHPHLVSIYEIGEHANVRFIAMEKIDGSTLRAIFSSQRLPLKRALELMVQITEALAAAHGAGVVHRDLKPENIMVSRTGYAKVLDFGLAKLHPETALPTDPSASTFFKATDSGTVLGTVGYMSPEQAQGKPADPRSDIFSLGCILYEAVAGRRAFHGANSIDTLHAIIHNEPAPLREIAADAPIELQRIVRKALAKDPEERYQSAKEMAIDLRNAGKEMESVAQTDAKRARLRVTPRLASIAAAVIIAAILIAEAVLRRTPAKPSLQIQRITTTGDVINATISPDGKYMVYVRSNEKGQSLWFRQLATNQDLELVSPTPRSMADAVVFWGHTFTPDGNAIIYVLKRSSQPEGALYRIATLGGRSEHLLNGIDSPTSFSPDGKRIAYVRADFPKSGESALMIAASDGSSAHAMAIRRSPEQFSPIWFTGPSWSPDGRIIAAATVHRAEDSIISKVIGIDPESGRETVIADAGWQYVGRVAWLPNGRGLIAIAGPDLYSAAAQVWFVPFPDGSPRQVTHDLLSYRSASVTADGKTVMSVATDQIRADIWRIPLDRRSEPEKLVAGSARGTGGLSYLPDGRIVFASIEGAISVISMANDGTVHETPLVDDRYRNSYPAAFANGIAYTSSTSKGTEICVTSLAGEERRVIVPSGEGPIAVTRDGKRLIYGNNGRLWKISMDDGRTSPVVSPQFDIAKFHDAPSWSPTGDRIAFLYGNFGSSRLGVVAADSGALLWSVPASVSAQGGFVRWTPDGSALLTNALGRGDKSNLWKIPLHGQAKKLTNFYGQIALAFDVSPDGKDIALARAELTRDAVLMTGFE